MTNLFLMPEQACNEQLRKMYLRTAVEAPGVKVIDCRTSLLGRLLLPAVIEITYRAQNRGKLRRLFCGSPTSSGLSHTGMLSPRSPRLTFTSEEIQEGWRLSSGLGLSPATPYVCVHIRDEAYLKLVEPDRDWSYHNYRNPEIESYQSVVSELLDMGYWVVRMGRAAEREFPVRDPRFIDYPFCHEKSDLLDVFLYAHARIAIAGSASGIDQIGYAFDVPAVVTNLIPFEPFMPVSSVYVTPVLLRYRKSGLILPLEEMLTHSHHTGRLYDHEGIDFVRNTSGEICSVVQEALGVRTNVVDVNESKQSLFWSKARQLGLFSGAEVGPPGSVYANPIIGSAFLNAHWDELMSSG